MAKDCQVQKGLRLFFLLWTVTLCSESQSEKYTIALPNLDTSREASETKINQHVMINTTTSEHVSKNNVKVRGTSFGLPVPIVHSSERPPDKEEKAQENQLYKSLWQTKAMVEDQLARSLNRSAGDVKSEIPCPTRCACDSNKTITVVDCSSRGLTRIPKFPASVREIHLRNNSIHIVTCTSFSDILHLTYLDISQNILKTLFACSFGTLRFLKHLISSDCQLTHLPSGIFDSLRNLQTLDLSKNNLSNIVPLIFKEMKELKSLQLHRNKLRQLRNDTFEGLTSLRSLSLHGNCLRYISNTFECEAFRGLPSLEELLIQENHPHMTDDFMYPDTALSRVPSLRRLRLDGWPRALGPGFSTLKNLTQLHMGNFGYCGMGSSIPFNFFSALSTNKPLELRMPRCGLTAIPPSLFKPLPNLYSLDLGENSHLGFDNFARGSVGLQNSSLEILNLTRIAHPNGNLHEIKNLTFRFLKNTPLRILLLEWNQLLYVSPKAMTDLPNSLEYISLYNNRLQNANFIFTILITFRNLRVFRLSWQLKYASTNPISFTTINNSLELPDTGTQNSETKELLALKTYENTNPQPEIIDSFKFSKSNVAKMREDNTFCSDSRNVFNKKTDQISVTLLPFPIESKLEILLASDIKASYDIPEIHITNNVVLRHIDYSKNYVRCFGGPLSGVPSLAYLDLSRNWCIRMNNRFFLHMTALKTLLLYENVLGQSLADDRVGLTFSTLIHLEILDLSVNALKDLSDHAFINNRALRLLNMSHNDLIQFRPNLANNINLDRLDLTKNRLQGFSQSACLQLVDIKRSNRNFKVLIKDNDFRCNCDNLHFLKLLLNEPDIFENIHLFRCQLVNGSTLGYERLPDVLSDLMTQCVAQVIFFFCTCLLLSYARRYTCHWCLPLQKMEIEILDACWEDPSTHRGEAYHLQASRAGFHHLRPGDNIFL